MFIPSCLYLYNILSCILGKVIHTLWHIAHCVQQGFNYFKTLIRNKFSTQLIFDKYSYYTHRLMFRVYVYINVLPIQFQLGIAIPWIKITQQVLFYPLIAGHHSGYYLNKKFKSKNKLQFQFRVKFQIIKPKNYI